MNLRSHLDQHRVIVLAVCGVLLLGVGFFAVPRLINLFLGPPAYVSPERELMAYFYDQNTKEIYVAPARHMGPIETQSGPFQGRPAGVRAHVYACRSCDDANNRFVAWLEMPTMEYIGDDPRLTKELLPVAGEVEETAFAMVRSVKDPTWVRGDTPEALKLYAAVRGHCSAGERPHVCRPPARAKE